MNLNTLTQSIMKKIIFLLTIFLSVACKRNSQIIPEYSKALCLVMDPRENSHEQPQWGKRKRGEKRTDYLDRMLEEGIIDEYQHEIEIDKLEKMRERSTYTSTMTTESKLERERKRNIELAQLQKSNIQYEMNLQKKNKELEQLRERNKQREMDLINFRKENDDIRINMARQTEPMICLLYTSPSPRDLSTSRMPSSA